MRVNSNLSALNAAKKFTFPKTYIAAKTNKRTAEKIEEKSSEAVSGLDIQAKGKKATQGRVQDADMAKDVSEQAAQNIRDDASTAVSAQANIKPQNVIDILD